MTAAWVALALAVIGAAACSVFIFRVARFAHLRRVGEERASGHLQLRRRMSKMAGLMSNPETYSQVARAETMYGWVWIRATRKPKRDFTLEVGWSPFRWSARRALARSAKR